MPALCTGGVEDRRVTECRLFRSYMSLRHEPRVLLLCREDLFCKRCHAQSCERNAAGGGQRAALRVFCNWILIVTLIWINNNSVTNLVADVPTTSIHLVYRGLGGLSQHMPTSRTIIRPPIPLPSPSQCRRTCCSRQSSFLSASARTGAYSLVSRRCSQEGGRRQWHRPSD